MKVIDLFAGCGGFSKGFEQNGFSIIKAVEFDPAIAKSYEFNHKGTQLYVSDIGKIDDTEHFARNESDVIIGGPPCQGFSMAGARIRNGFVNDPRNYLFKHYFNIVKIVKPEVFVIENVKGILTMEGGAIFNEIIKLFSDTNNFEGDRYYLHYKVVKAIEYGIPQKRERVIIIGRKNKDFDMEKEFETAREEVAKIHPHFFDKVTVWDAISNLNNPTESGECKNNPPRSDYQTFLSSNNELLYNHFATNHNKIAVERMEHVKQGENWTVLKDNIKSVHSGAYGRLEKDGCAATITTRFDTPSGGKFIHPFEDRTITPREAARIQSFPDDFVFIGKKSIVCKQIGNAVPPKMAYFLSFVVKDLVNENSTGKIK